MEYFQHPMECGHIVFATHQVLPFVSFWASQNHWHVFVDEELQVVKQGHYRVPSTHQLITDYIQLRDHDAIYGRVDVANEKALKEIAKNKDQDEILERFRETAQILINPNWDSFANAEQFRKLRNGTVKTLSIHSILMPQVLEGFASVTMASANFKDTLIYQNLAQCRSGVRGGYDPKTVIAVLGASKRSTNLDKVFDGPQVDEKASDQALQPC